MAKEIACIDIGTTKISLITVRITGEGPVISRLETVPSKGIRKGQIIDMEAVSDSIVRAFSSLSHNLTDYIIAGISGNGISIMESYGVTGIGGRRIVEQDIENAINFASSVYIPVDRELLHILPVEYSVDGEPGIKNPLGMRGYRLEAKVQIITASLSQVDNLRECFKRAGLRVDEFVFRPIAISRVVLKEEEMEEGVMLLDIGGGTTDIAIFKDKRFSYFTTLPVGGNHITNDLAVGLKVNLHEAERIKTKYGSALLRDLDEYIEIDLSRSKRSVSTRNIDEIVYPRCEEIISLIKKELSEVPEGDRAINGAVLTGGSALLGGMDQLFESIMGIPVRIGYPSIALVTNNKLDSPSLSVVAGLYDMVAERFVRSSKPPTLKGAIIEKIKAIILGHRLKAEGSLIRLQAKNRLHALGIDFSLIT